MPNPSTYFGSHVFDEKAMRTRLSKSTLKALLSAIKHGTKLAANEADEIAHAMMEWSMALGATHYTHWFQPLTGRTAQKHDAFLSIDADLTPLEKFSGSQLIQSEPDASSFPSGGMRSTFEARGYTAWDPSSSAFVFSSGKVRFLCIPSVFVSYTGHTLCKKTPLLRSNRAIGQAASKAFELLTGKKTKIHATIGAEQEYFLVDRKYFDQRLDLIMAGRTLIGSQPPKGQQMEDHYFGSIKGRVLAFMEEVERTLHYLGVPVKTRHNEVAPHQYETAPFYEGANIAADHNQLTMEVLQEVAKSHGLAALLNEKPFAGVNGSGKHLNWSLETSEGLNLLHPGTNPHQNISFLYFLVAAVHAVYCRGDILRSAIASAGNDHRLGANEAPPAIMSVFLGSHISDILDKIEQSLDISNETVEEIDLGLAALPNVMRDTTDRNRTSPFAFTGAKFEFRAVGSGQSISLPTAFLNAAVAESLNMMNAELEAQGKVSEAKVLKLLKKYIKKSRPVRFEGNNYSDEWRNTAQKAGLSNLRTTPEALAIWDQADARAFLAKLGILNEDEIAAWYTVKLEKYSKSIGIEAIAMLRLVDNFVLPASFRHQSLVATSVDALSAARRVAGLEVVNSGLTSQARYLGSISEYIGKLLDKREQLETVLGEVALIEDHKLNAEAYCNRVLPAMEDVRTYCDLLESTVDAQEWILPTYHELLFIL